MGAHAVAENGGHPAALCVLAPHGKNCSVRSRAATHHTTDLPCGATTWCCKMSTHSSCMHLQQTHMAGCSSTQPYAVCACQRKELRATYGVDKHQPSTSQQRQAHCCTRGWNASGDMAPSVGYPHSLAWRSLAKPTCSPESQAAGRLAAALAV